MTCQTCAYFKYTVGGQATGQCQDPKKIIYSGETPRNKPPTVATLNHCSAYKAKE